MSSQMEQMKSCMHGYDDDVLLIQHNFVLMSTILAIRLVVYFICLFWEYFVLTLILYTVSSGIRSFLPQLYVHTRGGPGGEGQGQGQLQEAYDSVRLYASIKESSNESELLAQFLEHLWSITRFADGHIKEGGLFCNWFRSMYKHPALNKYPCFTALVVDALFLRNYRIRTSMDCSLGQEQASSSITVTCTFQYQMSDLLALRPNLASYHRRQQVKNIGHKQLTDLAQFYLQLKKRLPSGQAKCHDYSAGPAWNLGEMLIALLGTCS